MTAELQKLKDAEKSAHDAYEVAQNQEAEARAALDLATDAEKKRKAGSILFTVFGEKLVSECLIPTAAVARRGIFHILPGSAVATQVSEVATKESVAFDTGYAGSAGLEPQSWKWN